MKQAERDMSRAISGRLTDRRNRWEMDSCPQARRVLLQQVAPSYHLASGSQKQQILEECVTTTGYACKYAWWLLNHTEEVFAPPAVPHRRYRQEVEEVLVLIRKTLKRIYAKSSIPFLQQNRLDWRRAAGRNCDERTPETR